MKKAIWLVCAVLLAFTLNGCGGGGGGGGGDGDDTGDIGSGTIGTLKYVPAGTFSYFIDSTSKISTITSSYWIGQYEITREQFADVLSVDPVVEHGATAYSSGLTDPVMMVNWYDAITFCNKLSIREGLTPAYSVSVGGTPIDWESLAYEDIPATDNADWNAATCNWSSDGYRLPTSSEWCWAFMGAYSDTFSRYYDKIVNGINRWGCAKKWAGYAVSATFDAPLYVVYGGDPARTSPVGTKLANELGVFDMSGNLYEWCWDWSWDSMFPDPTGPLSDYTGKASGFYRTIHGDCWATAESSLGNTSHLTDRTAHQYPYQRVNTIGFRVIRP